MADYQELYNQARNSYNSAVDYRNALQNRINSLQNQLNTLQQSLSTRNSELLVIQDKKAKVQDVINKCESIQENEFDFMNQYLGFTGEDYLQLFNADIGGAANIAGIYESDVSYIRSALNSVYDKFSTARITLIEEESEAQRDINNYSDQIDTVKSQLNSAGSVSDAQASVDYYYSLMKDYEKKMNE